MSKFARQLPKSYMCDTCLDTVERQKICITCSFQAEGMIVLDHLRKIIPDIPVVFLVTGYHFAQTYAYRDRVAKEWHLRSSTCFRTNLWRSRSHNLEFSTSPIPRSAASSVRSNR